MSEKVKMRAARLKDVKDLTQGQRDELIQLLKTDTLTAVDPDEYYVMRGYHLISMFGTMAAMKLLIEDLRNEMEDQ